MATTITAATMGMAMEVAAQATTTVTMTTVVMTGAVLTAATVGVLRRGTGAARRKAPVSERRRKSKKQRNF